MSALPVALPTTMPEAQALYPNVRPWSGRAAQRARDYMRTKLPAPCARCGEPVTDDAPWVVGHVLARATHPELTWVPVNWQHEHRACSDRSSQSVVIAKAKAEALRAAGIDPAFFVDLEGGGTPPPRPFSLSGSDLPSGGALVVPSRLRWSRGALARSPWLDGLLDPPDNATVPLAMTPVHPEAVGSYGVAWTDAEGVEHPGAVAWIESTQRITLRWWQRLAIVRQLEHRADGSLVWREVVESCPRRAGKSVRIRGLALWRMAHAELIGEVQTVLHCGNDLPICREIQRGAWVWSRSQGWKVNVSNGKEAIEAPDGSRWLVRSQDGVYGWEAGLAVVDEAWDVKPDTVSEGLEPAMLERYWSQLHLTSTAHRRATSLMKERISGALDADDGETLLLLWAAEAGSDPGSPKTWRAASPHWSADRERMISKKYTKAAAGEIDPEADDPDPMAGFTAQYLNVWQVRARKREVGTPIVEEEAWEGLRSAPGGSVVAVAVEGWPGEGITVAWAQSNGQQVVVSADDVPDTATAALLVAALGCARPAAVGASLADDPAWSGVRTEARTASVQAAVAELQGLLRDKVLLHAGAEHLSEQVLAMRTVPAPGGLSVRSKGRADAIKAAVWAASDARRKAPVPFRIR